MARSKIARSTSSLLALVAALILCAPQSHSDIFKVVDENGKVTYTDTQEKEAEKVELPKINTQPPQLILAPPPKKQAPPVRMWIQLTSPTPDYQVGPAVKTISLSLQSSRELKGDELFKYFINGQAVSNLSRKKSITVGPLKRGRNSASAQVVLPNGTVVASTEPVTFYVIRP